MDRGSLWGKSPWGRKESDTTEQHLELRLQTARDVRALKLSSISRWEVRACSGIKLGQRKLPGSSQKKDLHYVEATSLLTSERH